MVDRIGAALGRAAPREHREASIAWPEHTQEGHRHRLASRFRTVLPGTKTSIQLGYALIDEAAPVLLQVADGTPNAFGSETVPEMR